MTARLITRIFSFFLLASALFELSCTRVTDLRPEGRGEVVVVCVLTEEATQSLTLDLTDIATVEDRAALSEAVITLRDETTGTEVGRFVPGDGNEWRLDYTPVLEHSYILTISIPGRKIIYAATTMPPRSKNLYRLVLDSTNFFDNDENDRELGMQYAINSLPEGPVWVMGMNYNVAEDRYETAPLIAASLSIADPFNVTDEVYRAVDFQSEEVRNMLSEIRETGKADFYGNVEGHPLYDKMLRIPSSKETDREIAGSPPGFFSVAGPFEMDYITYDFYSVAENVNGHILFVSPSREYDLFLKDVLSTRMKQDKWGDYASIFSRTNIYSNIQNGLGVFGAKTEQKLPWNSTIHWTFRL